MGVVGQMVVGLLVGSILACCSPIVETTGKPELIGENRCDRSARSDDASRRLYRVRFVDKDFGRSPSDEVQVTAPASSTTRTYVGRSVPTELVETESSWLDWLVWAGIGEWVLLVLVFLFSGAPDGAASKKAGPRRRAVGSVVLVALLVAIPATGYFAGSRIYLDNAYDVPVKISIDGAAAIEVPARSAVPVRLSGYRFDVLTTIAEEPVETVRLVPDSGLWEMVWRTIWSRGEFVYNVCGENGYEAETAYYGR